MRSTEYTSFHKIMTFMAVQSNVMIEIVVELKFLIIQFYGTTAACLFYIFSIDTRIW